MSERFERHRQPWRQDEIQKLHLLAGKGMSLRAVQPMSNGKLTDEALKKVSREGTLAWKLGGFPLDDVQIRAKTGSAEVYGKQSTGWVASYTKDYVVVMMISQAGTGSGSTGEGVRAIWEALYGVNGDRVDADKAAIPGVTQPATLPTFGDDGSILPPARKESR